MSAPMPLRPARQRRTARKPEPGHLHFPSVHVRNENGSGYDYEEDLYLAGGVIRRVSRFAFVEHDQPVLLRETRDVLCDEEILQLQEFLPTLMAKGDPDGEAIMQDRAEFERGRQLRIGAGQEAVCLRCGCSESRGCSGGCLWVTPTMCSRCQ